MSRLSLDRSVRLASLAQRAPGPCVGSHFLAIVLICALSGGIASFAQPARAAAEAPAKAGAVAKSKPAWAELNTGQHAALLPLEASWNGLSKPQKTQWLALSRNFSRLPPAEQQTLHARMKDWAALSARQRSQARLNFSEIKRLSPQDQQTQWQAYQALSDEQKRALAEKATAQPRGAALPAPPSAKRPAVQLPTARSRSGHGARIQVAPANTPSRGRDPRISAPGASSAPTAATPAKVPSAP
ncbi:MAG: DUF3106 domain-containing protein [Variovorax sp.]